MTIAAELVQAVDDGVVIRVHCQPGAGRSAVVGRHGDAVKVKVAAPPVDGRANEAVAALLAEELGVPVTSITLLAGESSRSKRFKVEGAEAPAVIARLDQALERAGGLKPRR
jgi:uncharacterized protein (TIGR00251 family)